MRENQINVCENVKLRKISNSRLFQKMSNRMKEDIFLNFVACVKVLILVSICYPRKSDVAALTFVYTSMKYIQHYKYNYLPRVICH